MAPDLVQVATVGFFPAVASPGGAVGFFSPVRLHGTMHHHEYDRYQLFAGRSGAAAR